MSYRKNPLVLQKTTSEEKPLTEESFRKAYCWGESFFQEPPALQEKHTSEQEISILKKSLAFQEDRHWREITFKEPLAFKKPIYHWGDSLHHEAIIFKRKSALLRGRGRWPTRRRPPLKRRHSLASYCHFKRSLPLRVLFQDLSVLQEKHTDDGAVTLLKKPWALQKKDDEDDFLMEPLSFRKAHTTKEATLPRSHYL